jgi:hypothetical protein
MRLVSRRAERHQDLGAWAIPARRDGVLGEQPPYVDPILNSLRAHMGHGVHAEFDRLVFGTGGTPLAPFTNRRTMIVFSSRSVLEGAFVPL